MISPRWTPTMAVTGHYCYVESYTYDHSLAKPIHFVSLSLHCDY